MGNPTLTWLNVSLRMNTIFKKKYSRGSFSFPWLSAHKVKEEVWMFLSGYVKGQIQRKTYKCLFPLNYLT